MKNLLLIRPPLAVYQDTARYASGVLHVFVPDSGCRETDRDWFCPTPCRQLPAFNRQPAHMDPIFLYQRWLYQKLHEYVTSPRPPQLRGRDIKFSPSQYGAALMQAYLGKASLAWVAQHTGMPVQRLRQWRREPQFLLVMDWSKSIFSKAFHENLALNDYSVIQHHYIAGEISLLEESLRVAVRVPLYHRFKTLGRTLISRHQNDLSLSQYDLRLFRRFFLFFLALEHHWPSAAHHRIREDFLPLAKNVVWPLLDDKLWAGPVLESVQQTTPLPQIRLELQSKLSETLQRFLSGQDPGKCASRKA